VPSKSGDEPSRVEIQQGLRLVVGVDFNVLVLDAFFFEGDPDALDEGTKPATVELQSCGGGVSLPGR
jgi:hypothetical protein